MFEPLVEWDLDISVIVEAEGVQWEILKDIRKFHFVTLCQIDEYRAHLVIGL
ncbi:MAG: hypothetical protein MI807_04815 [Verrucomicrobiales bacterium]|nr:hypothetical protein [Verrucomicrobiales bacterium]